MPAIHPITRRDLPALIAVLLIAAAMRFALPEISEFGYDESILALLGQQVAAGEGAPNLGLMSSVGVPNTPVAAYVMALPYLVSSSPVAATMFVAGLNVLGVGLLWLLARRYVGRVEALAAGLAVAVNPWAVLFSRKIWAQDFHTPILLLALLIGLYGFVEGKRWAQALWLPVFLIGLQIHYAAAALVPLALVLLWMGRKHLSLPALAASAALGVLALLPFIQGPLASDPEGVRALLMGGTGRTLHVNPAALGYLGQLAGGVGLDSFLAPGASAEAAQQAGPLAGAGWLLALAVPVGLIAVWRRWWRPLAVFVTLWALLQAAVLLPGLFAGYIHYLTPTIPALGLLIGAAAGWAWQLLSPVRREESGGAVPRRPRWKDAGRAVLVAAVGLTGMAQAAGWFGLVTWAGSVNVSGFGTPLRAFMPARAELVRYRDVLIVGESYWTWSALLGRDVPCVRELAVAEGGLALFPAQPFAVIAPETAPLPALYRADARQVFPLRPGEGAYAVGRFDMAPAWDGAPLADLDPVHFANGVTLTGGRLDPDRLMLAWTLPARTPHSYRVFAHFMDAAGERIGQRDTDFWPGRYWCAGDRLITWVGLVPPEGTAALRVGMYGSEADGYAGVPVLDEAGAPTGGWADVPYRAGG